MARYRMAEESITTHQVLALHLAGENLSEVFSEDGQTPLDYRARLRGAQTGVGVGPL
jgi:hypothetical protein